MIVVWLSHGLLLHIYRVCLSSCQRQKIVFCIVFCIWMTSSDIHICALKQYNMSTCSQNKPTQRHLVEAENAILHWTVMQFWQSHSLHIFTKTQAECNDHEMVANRMWKYKNRFWLYNNPGDFRQWAECESN